MSAALHGARRSALSRGLSHYFQKLVLGDPADFDQVVGRYREALSELSMLPSGATEDRLAQHLIQQLLGLDAQPSAGDGEGGEWQSGHAGVLGLVMHCVGHAISELGFARDDEDESDDGENDDDNSDADDRAQQQLARVSGAAPKDLDDAAAETEEPPDPAQPERLDAARVGHLQGIRPAQLKELPLYQSLLRVRLGRALRFAVEDAYRKDSMRTADAPRRLGIAKAEYELFAEALLQALPEALGKAQIDWRTKTIEKLTQHVLWLAPGLKARLVSFLTHAPLTMTLQPLLTPPAYASRVAGDSDGQFRELPLLDYRRLNEPLRAFLELLQPSHFARVLPGLDAQQAVAWRLNQRLLACAQTLTELAAADDTGPAAGLDPSQVSAWRASSFLEAFYTEQQQRGVTRKILPGNYLRNPLVKSVIADAFVEGAPRAFYLPWKADYRGRFYPETPWFSPQGGDLQRALLEFAEGSVLDDKGWIALQRHGGNLAKRERLLADLDITDREVVTLTERQAWVQRHEQQILDCAANPLRNPFWSEMDEPWQFLAFCFAYADAKAGKPCHTPVQIDGTCNGLQHIAALTGDFDLAVEVNVCIAEANAGTPTELQGDIYSRIAARAREIFPDWLARARTKRAERLALMERLDAHPECFSAEAAQAVQAAQVKKGDGAKRDESLAKDPALLRACEGAATGDADAKALAALVVRNLKAVLRQLQAQREKQKRQKPPKEDYSERLSLEAIAQLACQRCAHELISLRLLQSLDPELLAAAPEKGTACRFERLLNRAAAKPVVMTIPYGASANSQADSVAGVLRKQELGLTEAE
ncbi:MAG: hypothetical protein KDI48_13130, partial [Xanthomonadales bacterium]|nr:hypothetical protein [Xanthomonadales bacterium]